MRRTVATLAVAAAAVLGLGVPAGAQADPPRGSCNAGTMNAHATVPHETEGNHVAHAHIPHCP
jgi:hypothetical protein